MHFSDNRIIYGGIFTILTINMLLIGIYIHNSQKQENYFIIGNFINHLVSELEVSDSCTSDRPILVNLPLTVHKFKLNNMRRLSEIFSFNAEMAEPHQIKLLTSDEFKSYINRPGTEVYSTSINNHSSRIYAWHSPQNGSDLIIKKLIFPPSCHSCHLSLSQSPESTPMAIAVEFADGQLQKNTPKFPMTAMILIIILWSISFLFFIVLFRYYRSKQNRLQMMEEILREKETQFSVLSQIAPVGILIFQEKKWVYANNEAIKISGYSFIELQGKTFFDLVYPEDRKIVAHNYRKREAGDKDRHHFVIRIQNKKGDILYLDVNTLVVTYHSESAILVVILDITEIQNKNAELNIFSTITKQSPASIVITNTAGDISYVNPKFEKVTGYSFQEVLGKNPRILKTDFLPPHVYKNLWETISSGEEWTGEFCNKRKDGSIFWELASISPIRNERGSITHYVAVKEDITKMKEYQNILRENEEKYRILVDNLNEPVAMIQEDTIFYANHQCRRFFHLSPENQLITMKELVGQSISELIHSEDTVRVAEGTYKVQLNSLAIQSERKVVHVSILPIIYQGLQSYICMFRDVTEETKILHSLQSALSQKTSLDGVIPICASCKKIREKEDKSDKDLWLSPEVYLSQKLPGVQFSHSICPDCMNKLYPDIYKKIKNKGNPDGEDK